MISNKCSNQNDLDPNPISNSSADSHALSAEVPPLTPRTSVRAEQEVGMNFLTSSRFVEFTTSNSTEQESKRLSESMSYLLRGMVDGPNEQTSEEFELTEYGRWYAEKVLDL